MVRLVETSFGGQAPIDSYGPGGFRVGGDWLEGSQILTPSAIAPLGARLSEGALAPLLERADEMDVVLVGQGAEIAALPGALRRLFEEAGLGVEVMSTPSACRTYNVLLAEARRVGAVLIAL